jgi:hypothetical protein
MSIEVTTDPESKLSEAGIKLQDTVRAMTEEFVALCAAHSRDKSIPSDTARIEVIGTLISGAGYLTIAIASMLSELGGDNATCDLCRACEEIKGAAQSDQTSQTSN